MAEEQILDCLESMVSFHLEYEFEYLRMQYSDKKFDAKTCKKLLQDDASCAIHLMDVLDYIKDKKAKLQNSSEPANSSDEETLLHNASDEETLLHNASDEALLQEIIDRGLEKYASKYFEAYFES